MSDIKAAIKNFQIESYLDSRNIPYIAKNAYYLFEECPGCGKEKKMILNKEEKYFRCFVCDAHGSLIDFMCLVEGIDVGAAIHRLINRKTYIEDGELKSHLEKPTVELESGILPEVVLPFYFRQIDLKLETPEAKYSISRGLTQELIDMCDIRYSEWEKRIVFPVHDIDSRLVFWQGRDITGLNPIKVLTAPLGAKKAKVLGYFNNVCDESEITIAEGPVDAIKAYQGNAVCLFGKQISKAQEALLMSNKNLRRVNLGLDPDAYLETAELASLLSGMYDVRIVRPPAGRGDLGDCSVDEATEAVRLAMPYSDYRSELISLL